MAYIEGDQRQKLKRLGKAVGLTVRQMSWEQMRLSSNAAVKFTFPRKKADSVNAIENDMMAVMWPVSGKFANRGQKINKTWKAEGGSHALKTSQSLMHVQGNNFKPGTQRLQDHIKANRNRRTGRAKGMRSFKVGNVSFTSKMVVTSSAFGKEVKLRKGKIGQMKAGWLPAANYYAGKSKGDTKAPAWVKGQKKKMGTYKDSMGKSGNGSMSATNTVPYWPDKKRIALENLVHSIAQKRINGTTQGQIDKLAKRFNAGTI